MDLKIKGKTALVGASGQGLGLACAMRLAMEGCNVALCDLNPDALEKAARAVGELQPAGRVGTYPVDLTNGDSISAMVEKVEKDLGPVDILVTNSGGPPPGGFEDATDEKWLRAYDLTFLSAVRLIRQVLPGMKQRQWGRIINLCSRTLREPIFNLMISNALRLAVAAWPRPWPRKWPEPGSR